jgi:hypothetical protein
VASPNQVRRQSSTALDPSRTRRSSVLHSECIRRTGPGPAPY